MTVKELIEQLKRCEDNKVVVLESDDQHWENIACIIDTVSTVKIMRTHRDLKIEIQDVMKALVKKGVYTSMYYDKEKDQHYVDLETRAKSELHLYEDGTLCGRYGYKKRIDLTQDIEELITELCYEFNRALHGRGYCQSGWAELCHSKNIELTMYEPPMY